MSKNTKIILSVVGVLVVLAAAIYIMQSRGLTSVKNLNGDSSNTFKTTDGEGVVTSGGSVPLDFPSDMFVYPSAKIIGSSQTLSGRSLALETYDNADSVISFYSKLLVSKSWEILKTDSVDSHKIIVAANENISVMINTTVVKDKTIIILNFTNKVTNEM